MNILKLTTWSYFRAINILIICCLTACSSHSFVKPAFAEEKNIERKEGDLETLYNIEIREDSIWATVKSNGCTSEKNFKLELTAINEQRFSASIIRTKSDFCRAMPRIVSIELFSEQLANNIVINNAFAVKTDNLRKSTKRNK